MVKYFRVSFRKERGTTMSIFADRKKRLFEEEEVTEIDKFCKGTLGFK